MIMFTSNCFLSGFKCIVMSMASLLDATTFLYIDLKNHYYWDSGTCTWNWLEARIVCAVCMVQDAGHLFCCFWLHLFKQGFQVDALCLPEPDLCHRARSLPLRDLISTVFAEHFINLNVTCYKNLVNLFILHTVYAHLRMIPSILFLNTMSQSLPLDSLTLFSSSSMLAQPCDQTLFIQR